MTSSSYVWGAVADRKGRKPVIITSCLLLGLFSAAFGFSVNFAMAVLFRLAVGLTNGKHCDVRCYMYRIAGNFREAEIFAIFAIECQLTKICSHENFFSKDFCPTS